jgi:histidinol-phosphate aminotransferase
VLAALEVEDELLENVAVLAERCARLQEALREQGWPVPEMQGNFVWLPTGDGTSRIAEALGAAGLVVRAFPPEGIRVSIGEEESVSTLLRICGEVVRTL